MDGSTAHHPVAGSEAGQAEPTGLADPSGYSYDDSYDDYAAADLSGGASGPSTGVDWAPAADDLVPPPAVFDDFVPDDPDDVREARLTRWLTAGGVLIGAGAIVALAFAVVSYVSSGGPHQSTPAAGGVPSHAAAQRADRAEQRPDAAAGQQLTDNSWVLAGTQFAADPLGQYGGTFQVTNAASSPRTGVFTITLLANGQPVARLKGVATDVMPGQTATVKVVSTDKWVDGSTTLQFENTLR
jgi:hypothetical protein